MHSFNAKVFSFPHYIFQTCTQNSVRLLKQYPSIGKEKQTLISVCFCVNDKFSCASSSFPTLHFFHPSLNGQEHPWIFSRHPSTGPCGTPTWCRNWFHSCPRKPECVLNVRWLKSRPAQSRPRRFTTSAAVLQFTPLNCVAVPLGFSARV